MFPSIRSYRRFSLQCISSVVLFGIALTSGCGGPANGRLGISGKVILDGTPLDQGIIEFNDVAGELPSAGASIIDGEFRIPDGKGLLPGQYAVAIDSADSDGPTGRAGPYAMAIPISRIPPRYNAETTLAAEVTATGVNEFTFDLSTKP